MKAYRPGKSTNAADATMPGVRTVSPEGSAKVTPGPSTIYTLTPETADIGKYTAIATVTVIVPLMPGSDLSPL